LLRVAADRQRDSLLFGERWFAVLIGYLFAGDCNFGSQFAQHGFGLPPHDKVRASNARGPTAQLCEYETSHVVDRFVDILLFDKLVPLFHQLQSQHFGFGCDVLGIRSGSRRPAMLRAQVCEILQP
jgi:hypothetical protein